MTKPTVRVPAVVFDYLYLGSLVNPESIMGFINNYTESGVGGDWDQLSTLITGHPAAITSWACNNKLFGNVLFDDINWELK